MQAIPRLMFVAYPDDFFLLSERSDWSIVKLGHCQ